MKRPDRYNTRQLEAILKYIKSLEGNHVTAGRIAEFFCREGSPIGLTTVYRHLDRLTARGMVRKYHIDGASGACYQYAGNNAGCNEHFHLKCEGCGMLLHIECELMNSIGQHVSDEHAFEINTEKTVFYGKCAECKKG